MMILLIGVNLIFESCFCECWVFGLKVWMFFRLLLKKLSWIGFLLFGGKILIILLCIVKLLGFMMVVVWV